MSALAIGAALVSALIHAAWNAMLKAGSDRLADSAVMALGWLAVGVAATLALPPIAPAAWPYIAAHTVIHALYWFTLTKGFGAGDMSHIYTLSRGVAPALITVAAAFLAQEVPSAFAATGIALVCAGVLAVGFSPRAPAAATFWAVCSGICIAAYSVNDGIGVRLSGQAWTFAGWTLIANAVPILLVALWRRGPARLVAAAKPTWRRGAAAGLLSAFAYAIVLWAQTFAPIAYISALRETSVVFGALIAFVVLKERLDARRWLGAGVVALGAGVIALA